MNSFLSSSVLALAMAAASLAAAAAEKSPDFEEKVERSLERVHAAHPPADPSNLEYYALFRDLRRHYKEEMPSLFDSPTWPEFIAKRTVEHMPKYLALKKQKELQKSKIENARNRNSRLRFNKKLSGGGYRLHKVGSLAKPQLHKPQLDSGGKLGERH